MPGAKVALNDAPLASAAIAGAGEVMDGELLQEVTKLKAFTEPHPVVWS